MCGADPPCACICNTIMNDAKMKYVDHICKVTELTTDQKTHAPYMVSVGRVEAEFSTAHRTQPRCLLSVNPHVLLQPVINAQILHEVSIYVILTFAKMVEFTLFSRYYSEYFNCVGFTCLL